MLVLFIITTYLEVSFFVFLLDCFVSILGTKKNFSFLGAADIYHNRQITALPPHCFVFVNVSGFCKQSLLLGLLDFAYSVTFAWEPSP